MTRYTHKISAACGLIDACQAVAVWAEHVLPFAAAEYWNEFARRLDAVWVSLTYCSVLP